MAAFFRSGSYRYSRRGPSLGCEADALLSMSQRPTSAPHRAALSQLFPSSIRPSHFPAGSCAAALLILASKLTDGAAITTQKLVRSSEPRVGPVLLISKTAGPGGTVETAGVKR